MTVVVHSFVADGSLLDRCDLVVIFVCVFFSTLCLQLGNRLGFWGGFSCFVSFIWCQLFACLIREPFFVCHQPLSFGLFFFATGICGLFSFFATGICVQSFFHGLFGPRHSCWTCLCLVSTCFSISVYLLIFFIMLCACCLSASSLESWTGIFFGYPVDSPSNCFEANPIWYSNIKFMKSHSVKCSLHKWAWLRHSFKVSSFELSKFDPFLPHSGSIPRELVHSYALI